jgi:hypothetical protein
MTFLARPAARAHRQISAAASALADEANLIHLTLIREVFGKSSGHSFFSSGFDFASGFSRGFFCGGLVLAYRASRISRSRSSFGVGALLM